MKGYPSDGAFGDFNQHGCLIQRAQRTEFQPCTTERTAFLLMVLMF